MNEALRGRVLELMKRHGIGYLDYAGPDGVLTLDADLPEQEHPPISAACAGIFLWRHPAERAVAAWPRWVRAGEVIGWLKIGPLLEPVCANEDALVRRPRLVDGALAGYGERLF
jgi:acetyl-CoA carboxylase biotin carboxyl carrier protein